MADDERIIAGCMSGTSADGVDIAITRVTGHGLGMTAQLVHHHDIRYHPDLRRRIFAIRESGNVALSELADVGREITLVYARTVNEALAAAKLSPAEVTAIAAHGQTLYHAPPNTIQWLDPALLAAETKCQVVSDFRRADCAAGGQGAPLVPFADFLLFRHPTKNRVLLNIGGIANLTWLKAGGTIDDMIAFDTGPGNCVIDHVCRKEDPNGLGFDLFGELSRRGQPDPDALNELLHVPFIRAKPPKSTDGPAMIAAFESLRAMRNAPFLDRVATANLFCTTSIFLNMKIGLPAMPDELIVSGGGTKNVVIMEHLRRGPFGVPVTTTDEHGMPSQSKEAIAFALLAAATLDGEPSNVPSVTGASRKVVLGSTTPRP